jgi:hypothetical protein
MVVDLDPDGSEIICNLKSGEVINSGSGFLKISFFAMFRLSALHMCFSSTTQIQKCTGFKISFFCHV